MSAPGEFHYRLPGSAGGHRPGAHAGSSLGTGLAFAAHARLLDHPDPRRLDLRASVRDMRRQWLVRLHRQRVAVPVHAVVDVSASMRFGAHRSKLQVAADFADALGISAYRAGDPAGLLAFDATERTDLLVPARHSRGIGSLMAQTLRGCDAAGAASPASRPGHAAGGVAGLRQAVARLNGRHGLVFLVSDFHWPLDGLEAVLEALAPACVVPLVAWDTAEIEPPAAGGLLELADAESGARRTLWIGQRVRARWREAVAQRRARLDALFEAHGLRPLYLHGAFDPQRLSQHFLENVA